MAHPLRVKVFTVLLDRKESTSGEIAAEIGETRNAVNHHLGVLVKIGCAERAKIASSSGGRVVKYIYRVVEDRAYFSLEEWEQLDPARKRETTNTLLRVISEELDAAVVTGTFFDPDDGHLSRSPLRVDMQGWEEVRDYLDESCLAGLGDVQKQIDERCRGNNVATFPIKVVIIQHRSPEKERKLGQKKKHRKGRRLDGEK
jgi:DNA-binding transcriptional ArsR family regulator